MKFYKGDWVRVIKSENGPHLVGLVGRVNAIAEISGLVDVDINGDLITFMKKQLEVVMLNAPCPHPNPPKEPTAAERKTYPVGTGVIDYFPDAILEVAHISYIGNQQHHPGKPLHWDRTKSTDEADALMRHFIDRGKLDTDGTRHSAKLAWRSLALLQKEIEAERNQ